MKFPKHSTDMVFLGILILVTVGFWIPTVTLPYWWDSAGFIMQQAHQYALTNFSPLISSFSDFAHPPLLSIMIALFWRVFGESLAVSHIVYLPFVLLAVFSTYFLGKELFQDRIVGPILGFTTAVLLLFTPVFLAQVGIIYLEIPSTAFAVTSYLFFLKKRYVLFALSASMMVLMKEYMLFIVLLFLFIYLYRVLKNRKNSKSISLEKKNILFQIIPFIVMSAWLLLHKISTGWWIVMPGRSIGDSGGYSINFLQLVSVFSFLFLSQWRVLLLLILLSCLVGSYFFSERIWKRQQRFWSIEKLPLFFIPIFYLFFFGKTEFLARYSLIVLPFFYLLSLLALLNVFSVSGLKKKFSALVVVFVVCLYGFFTQWDLHRQIKSYHFSPLEENLEYRDIIFLGRQVSSYMTQNYHDKAIYSSFPFTYMLSMPYQGFIDDPLRIKECSQFKKGDRVDVVIYHLFSPGSPSCLRMLEELKPQDIKRFNKNGKGVIVATFTRE